MDKLDKYVIGPQEHPTPGPSTSNKDMEIKENHGSYSPDKSKRPTGTLYCKKHGQSNSHDTANCRVLFNQALEKKSVGRRKQTMDSGKPKMSSIQGLGVDQHTEGETSVKDKETQTADWTLTILRTKIPVPRYDGESNPDEFLHRFHENMRINQFPVSDYFRILSTQLDGKASAAFLDWLHCRPDAVVVGQGRHRKGKPRQILFRLNWKDLGLYYDFTEQLRLTFHFM